MSRAQQSPGLDVSVSAPDLAKLHNDLKRAGSEFRKELRKGVAAAVKPVVVKVKQDAKARGLSKAARAVRVDQKYNDTGAVIGVRVVRGRAQYARTGTTFRHPVFPKAGSDRRTWNWSTQKAQHEFFESALKETRPEVERKISEVMREVSRKAGMSVGGP